MPGLIGQAEDAARIIDFIVHVGPQRWILPEFLRLRAATERLCGRRDDATFASGDLKASRTLLTQLG